MAQIAEVVLAGVVLVLNDAGYESWEESELLHWLNDGLLAIALLKPGAFSERKSWRLAAGKSRQDLPEGSLQLIGPLYNMGADGATQGRAILLGNRETKDRFEPSWRAATPAATVKEYFYDVAREPKVFDCWPPVHATTPVYVEGAVAVTPESVDGAGEPLPCDDLYIPALQEWVVYRAFSKDGEQTPSFGRSARAAGMFFNLLGVKPRTEIIAAPKVRQMLEQSAQPGG